MKTSRGWNHRTALATHAKKTVFFFFFNEWILKGEDDQKIKEDLLGAKEQMEVEERRDRGQLENGWEEMTESCVCLCGNITENSMAFLRV